MKVLSVILIAAAASLVPNAQVQGQGTRHPLIAVLEPGPLEPGRAARPSRVVAVMKEALGKLGWVEGQTARFETRYGDWEPDRIREIARELVHLKPDVLYTHSNQGVLAATQATTSIPIVAAVAADLLGIGVVRSLGQPGGNVTGMTLAMGELDRKRLEMLRDAVPSATRIAHLFVPGMVDSSLRALDDSARRLGVEVQHVAVREAGQLEAAFTELAKRQTQAVFVMHATVTAASTDKIVALALKHRLPTVSQLPRFAERGGLIQYGADIFPLVERSATHVDKILRGAKPGDIPVEQPTKVDLVINLKTARALGLTIPPSLLARADQIIE